MSRQITAPSPDRFGLGSFAEMLSGRGNLLGEDATFDVFHEFMLRSLTPFTAYECVIAENLIAIEFELVQRRRMRDASVREQIRQIVSKAVVEQARLAYVSARDAAWQEFAEAGGEEDDWEYEGFDIEAAQEQAEELAARAASPDRKVLAKARDEIVELGLEPVALMSEAYLVWNSGVEKHDEKIQHLERRRREVRRDYDALQKARPLEAEVIDA